jgi:hypothetical protein
MYHMILLIFSKSKWEESAGDWRDMVPYIRLPQARLFSLPRADKGTPHTDLLLQRPADPSLH